MGRGGRPVRRAWRLGSRGAGSLLPIVPLWLLFSAGRPTRRTLALGALSLVVALGSVGGYIEWRHAASGLSGADHQRRLEPVRPGRALGRLHQVHAAAGTQHALRSHASLAAGLPRGKHYIYSPTFARPAAVRTAVLRLQHPHAMGLLQRFSEAAILGQPLDYLHAVWLDMTRLFDPNPRVLRRHVRR